MELQVIKNNIIEIRGYRVMMDFYLSELYGVETKVLNQAVRRNIQRFPNDFMFQLTKDECNNLRSQIVTSSWGGSRYLPYAFTEQGVAMLSGILRSAVAIEVNISIMRAFVMARQFALEYSALKQQLDKFMMDTNTKFSEVYQVLTALSEKKKQTEEKPKLRIGFERYLEELKR
jgi:hypothetical protein